MAKNKKAKPAKAAKKTAKKPAAKPAKVASKVAPKAAPKAAKALKVVPPPTETGKKAKARAQQIIRDALTEAAMSALPEKEVILTNADGMRYCKVADCDELATSDSYCRFHYLLNW